MSQTDEYDPVTCPMCGETVKVLLSHLRNHCDATHD